MAFTPNFSSRMAMDSVQVIPPSIDAGKAQMVVVKFPCDLPQDKLITLELKYNKSSRKSSWNCWVPGQQLGLKCLQAQLPEIPHPGEVDVFVKVSRVAFSLYPKFQLYIHSPVETIFHSLAASQQGSHITTLACIAAYLLHTHEKDPTTISHNDTVVCRALQSHPSFTSEWSLSSLIFGKYGTNESLLHLFVRCKLDGAASLLLEKTKGKDTILQQQDYRGRTPAEIARKKGSKRIAEMVDAAITNAARSTNYEYRDPVGKLKKSKSLEQGMVYGVFSSDEDIGPLPIQLPTNKRTGVKQMFHKIQSKLSDDKKSASPVMQPSTPTHSEDIHPEPSYMGQPSTEPLQQLLSRCIYKASVLKEYHWENSPFADKVSLKKGDIVYVIKDLENNFCQGVCNNFYCTVPKYILATDNEDDDYVHMSPVDSSDYEDIEEGDYDIPQLPDIEPIPSPLQPDPLHMQTDSITEKRFKPPPMRPPIKTQAPKPQPLPGRLLPDCSHSSSHDTGLDRLGLPRQVSKGKIPTQQPPFSSRFKYGVNQDSSQFEKRVSCASSSKPVRDRPIPAKEAVASPPSESESEGEYDDAISIQQIQEQQQQRLPKPPVKTPVARAASHPRVRPAIKPRNRLSSSETMKTKKPPSPLPRVKREQPRTTAGSASPSVSDRRKMFENN